MVINFSKLDCSEAPLLILKNLDGTPIQTLGYAFNVEAELSYNSISTIKFDLPAYVDGRPTPNYNEVVGMKIVELVGIGQFLLIDPVVESDGIREIKSCTANSLEYEFAKKNIYLEAGTYNFFSGTNVNDETTIIGRIHERLPDWAFYIDEDLIGRYRTFEDLNKKVYEFMMSDVQESYGCIFNFDTYERRVYVKSVTSNVATKQLYISNESLIKEIDIEEDSDGIVTCLDVNGAEGISIRSVNPTGTNKIYNLDYFMTENNVSRELITKWKRWQSDCEAQQDTYYYQTVLYNTRLLQLLTEESKLSDISAELIALENVQAVIIQGIAVNAKSNEDLIDINNQISSKRSESVEQKSKVESLRLQTEEIHKNLEQINRSLDMDRCDAEGNYIYFTPDELRILRRYFIEDVLQDTSFVQQTVATYDSKDLNTDINNEVVALSSPARHTTISPEGSDMCVVEFDGGTINVDNLNAKVIKATFCEYTDGSSVLTAYLERGTVGEASFNTGNLTITCDTYSHIVSPSGALNLNVSKGRLYFTKNCTEYEKHQIEWDLYRYGKEVLTLSASPKYNFSVDCCNFLSLNEYRVFHNQLSLGERVYLNIDGEILEPYVTSVSLKYNDPTSLSIEFSNTYTSFDKSFALAKLLEQSVSLGKTLDYKSGAYSSFINSGASTKVKEFMDSALDIAKNAVLSSGNQAIEFNDAGLRLRKWIDNGHTAYEPEQIWAVNNNIVFTDDNWETAKMAIGKIFDPNLVSADNPQGFGYGIAAPYIVGTILAGNNLIIESAKKDGGISVFRVDGSGATLHNASFDVVTPDNHISLNPEFGIAIGGNSLFVTDDNGVTTLNEEDAVFWVDNDGNLHLKGTLSGCDGVFSGKLDACTGTFSGELSACTGTFTGIVRAKDFQTSSGKSMLNGEKIDSKYLDLYGITVKNLSNETTFMISDSGNVTINGDITLGDDVTVKWENVIGSDDIEQDIENANSFASDAYSLANSANNNATMALNVAAENNETVSGWRHNGSTYIDGSMIAADTIMASKLLGGQVGLLTQNKSQAGWIDITGSSSSGYAIELGSGNALRICANDGDLYLYAKDNDGRAALTFSGYWISCDANYVPASTNNYFLGDGDIAWSDVWSFSYQNASDRNKKNSIDYNMERYEEMFFRLKPAQFKFNEGTSDRYHVGFISQDVGDAVVDSGLSTQDFAGFVKAPKKGYTLSASESDCNYYLRYNEFVSLNTHMIQKLYKRVEELENTVEVLKNNTVG